MRRILRNSSIGSLSAGAGAGPHLDAPADVSYPGSTDAYPCTGMQQGLLLSGVREPGNGL